MALFIHLVKSLFRGFFKITFAAFVSGGLATEALLVAARYYGYAWPPSRLVEIVAIAVGVLTAYAAGLTALLFESLRAALTVERGVIKGVEKELLRAGR